MTQSVFIKHIPCTGPNCSSSDGLAVYRKEDGSHDAFCFVCGHFEPNPFEDNEPKSADTDTVVTFNSGQRMAQIDTLPSRGDEVRSIYDWAFHYYGVKTELSEADGRTVTSHFYPYYKAGTLTGYKERRVPKDFSVVGDTKGTELFGQRQASASGGKRLFITEGELDAVSLYQCLKERSANTQWAKYEPAVVSICHGAKAAVRDISRNMDFVKSFQQVVLCMDQDADGEAAAQELLKLLPTALVATFEEKDANAMLSKSKGAALTKAVLFDAKTHKPSSVVSVSDVFDRAIKMPEMGMSWPWPTLTKATYGIHRKMLYGLGAGVGIGKTDFAKELQAHIILNHKLPIGAIMLEEDVGRTLKGIAGKISKKQFHRPDSGFTQQELIEGITNLKEKVFLYDHFGVKNYEEIKTAIRYMVVAEGVKDIFIDPLTALVSHLTSGEANDALNTIMGDLAGLTHELDFTAYYFCHLNPPQSGPAHERGGKVHEGQFTGSRAMMRYSQFLLGLERNKDPEIDEVSQNTSYLVLLKDREFGNTCRFPIYYDRQTGSFLEPEMGGIF